MHRKALVASWIAWAVLIAAAAIFPPVLPRLQGVIDFLVVAIGIVALLSLLGYGVDRAEDWGPALSAFCVAVAVGCVYGVELSRPLLAPLSAPAAFAILFLSLKRSGVYRRVRPPSEKSAEALPVIVVLNALALVPFVLPRRGFVAIAMGVLAAAIAIVLTILWFRRGVLRGARLAYAGAIVCAIAGAIYLSRVPAREVSLTELARAVTERPVRVEFGSNDIRVLLQSGEWIRAQKERSRSGAEALADLGIRTEDLREIPVAARTPMFGVDGAIVAVAGVALLVSFAAMGVLVVFVRASKQHPQQHNDFARSRERLFAAGSEKASFDSIVGATEAKKALQEIAAVVADPTRVEKLGGRPRRGVLLVGPPGTGKTLLARALASAVNARFYYISASDFVELYVGVGAARIRDLFAKARKTAPSVVFIDEIDGLGRRRAGASGNAASGEREQALNQILVELDGFAPNTGVVVVAATNRADVLDEALMRPGRFDRRIEVARPTPQERRELLAFYTRAVPLAKTFDLDAIARNLPGATGADIESIANEAAQSAASRKNDVVEQSDFERALELTGKLVRRVDLAKVEAAVRTEVFGQDSSVRSVAMAVGQHYGDLRLNEGGRGSKQNVLLIGPPGVGKTALVSAVARATGVPFARIDASALVQHPSAMLLALDRLLAAANSDVRAAERGIVCIEGCEALAKSGIAFSQDELARWIDGRSFDIVRSSNEFGAPIRLDTTDVLFILETTIAPLSRGFDSVRGGGVGARSVDAALRSYSRRLLDRFPIIVNVPALAADALRTIADGGDHSLIWKASRRYEDMAYAIKIERPDGLAALIEEALRRGGGARSLAQLVDEVLLHQSATRSSGRGGDDKELRISPDTVRQFLAQSPRFAVTRDSLFGSPGVWTS